MNKSVKMVLLFDGMFMPCAAEIAKYIYDTHPKTHGNVISSVRRRVNEELEAGVQANILTRVLGRQQDNTKSVTRFTSRGNAERSRIGNRAIEVRSGTELNGNTKRVRQCLGEMVARGVYRDKVFSSLDASIEPLFNYIKVLDIPPAIELQSCNQFKMHWKLNIRHTLQNHFGILNDKAFSLATLKSTL